MEIGRTKDLNAKKDRVFIPDGSSLKGYSSAGNACYGHDEYDGKPFRMVIDDIFQLNLNGGKCVLTGCIEEGCVRTNDVIYINGKNDIRTTTVLGIEMFRQIWPYAEKGDNVGILISDDLKDIFQKGMVVSSEELVFSQQKLQDFLNEEKWEKARDYCLKHIESQDSLCHPLVSIYQRLNDFQKSLEMIAKVKKLENYSSSDVLKWATAFGEYKAYMALKEYKKAKPICEYFISIVPDDKVKRDGSNMKQEAQTDLEVINNNLTSYSSNEQEYLENLKEFIDDKTGITERERKMLDRIRQSLGISEERAVELEASLSPKMTDDEKEYLDMYREYAEKGEILEKERRRLDKFAQALGIESGRIKELEHIMVKS